MLKDENDFSASVSAALGINCLSRRIIMSKAARRRYSLCEKLCLNSIRKVFEMPNKNKKKKDKITAKAHCIDVTNKQCFTNIVVKKHKKKKKRKKKI